MPGLSGWKEITDEMRSYGVTDLQGAYEWSDKEGKYNRFNYPGAAYDPIYDAAGNRVG